MTEHDYEVMRSERFEFGKNWSKFLKILDNERISEAIRSLKQMLEIEDLVGKSFLDIGSGSGLFSLAARYLGAQVHSFDYDPQSVFCTNELKKQFFHNDNFWNIQEGNVLDVCYLKSLGKFDVVYSWGVLHHTGNMWKALENVSVLVNEGGYLFISIYNDQGAKSRRWKAVKKFYNKSPISIKIFLVLIIGLLFEIKSALGLLLEFKNPLPFKAMAEKKKSRGMSIWYDLIDWVGGYPFEVTKPEEIFDYFRNKGYLLRKLKTCGGGSGCNEFVFEKTLLRK